MKLHPHSQPKQKDKMNEEIKNALIALSIGIHDMDLKTVQAISLIKKFPIGSYPLDVLEFFENEINERKKTIERLQNFTISLENR